MPNRSRRHHEARGSAAEQATLDDLAVAAEPCASAVPPPAPAPWEQAVELLEVMITRLIDDARAAAERARSTAGQGVGDETAARAVAHLSQETARAVAAAEAESAAARTNRSRAVDAVARLRTTADAVAVRLDGDLADLRVRQVGLKALLDAVREARHDDLDAGAGR
ncbi:MAG TPA: hypothetical protein VNS46_19190 [Nocardioides sp.]|nr:hypothetical protein [Nocardioides sp.]